MELLKDAYEWVVDPFMSYQFMRYALAAGVLVAVITSLVGTWVVLRGMSFLSEALAHGVMPGIALAFVMGVNTTIGAYVAAIAMVSGVHVVRSLSPFPEDTSIGILFVGFLAAAVVIVSSHSDSYFGDLNRFLFGSIAGVDAADVVRLLITALLIMAVVVVFYRAFLVATFDECQAKVLGLHPKMANAVLLVALAVSIVSSFEVVGNLLVFAFLVTPSAAAAVLVRRIPMIMVVAVTIGIASVIVGLLISYHYDTAPAATMALLSFTSYLAVLVFTELRQTLSREKLSSLIHKLPKVANRA